MNDKMLFEQQLARYPKLHVQDLVKAMYQSEFGPGHFVDENGPGREYLRRELAECTGVQRECKDAFVEPLGGGHVRVHLNVMAQNGLSPETLFRLFVLSGQEKCGDMQNFRAQLDALEEMINAGELPLDMAGSKAFLAQYRAAGCPSTHHSDGFRQAYAPAYRVIRAEYANALPLLCAIDRLMAEKERVTVAIEGGSASGKTSLSRLLSQLYDCNIFHMDDFFLQPHQRTPERFAEPGGNVDRERFLTEVLQPLQTGEPFAYRVFDCSCMALGGAVDVQPKQLNIVEGAYSMHPELADAYDLSAYLAVDPALQAERILHRNGAKMQQRFLNEWIPLEHRYFEHMRVPERCALTLRME